MSARIASISRSSNAADSTSRISAVTVASPPESTGAPAAVRPSPT
jgi:hypothetical protein